MKKDLFPPLPLEDWEPTKKTLHLLTQIVGKIRMAHTPKQNHWWHVPLYVGMRGLTTGPIPYNTRKFEITFDFIDHKLKILTDEGQTKKFDLQDGLSVASFYRQLFAALDQLDIEVEILARPYDHESTIPFAEDDTHHHYDREYVDRYWTILTLVDKIFKKFSGRFYGKTCPVQLYWHSFDLAVTRFSGRQAPDRPDAGRVDREAYSHEVISFGFWPGDQNLREAAFYSYTFPAPEGLEETRLQPNSAQWIEQNGSPMALLMYEDVLESEYAEDTLLQFLESAYQAGAQKAGWDVEHFTHDQ